MVVDPGHQHVFVSSGVGGSTIVVLDFSGAIVKTITGESGASQMAVDTATHTLYVALHDANAISEIDTQTLTETTRFSVAPYADPYSLVIAGGKLWFTTDSFGHAIVSANLDGTGFAVGLNPAQSVLLSAGGASNDLLATASYGSSSTDVSLYDVSSGQATPVNGPLGDPGGSACGLGDFSVSPSGSYVLLASPCQNHAAALATDLQGSSHDYPSELVPNAVAWSPDGQYAAVGAQGGGQAAPIIEVFPTGGADPTWGWALSALPHDLAFSPDGLHLFALVGANGGIGFEVLDQYTAPDTQITSGPAPGSTTYTTSASFSFTSHNAPVTFQCSLDGSDWKTCSSPQNLGVLADGSHTFAVRSAAGANVDPAGASRTWTILPPNTRITSGPSDPSYAPEATFGFTSDDTNGVFFRCKLDGGSWFDCLGPTVTYSNLAAGSHTFQVEAHELAANRVDPVGATKTWTILPGGKKLSVFKAGVGFGAVKSAPAGIACNTNCSAWFAGGTAVTLTATPALGSRFSGWSGACTGTAVHCVVSMSQARSVTATFVKQPKQTLTVKKSGAGTVKSSPPGISCGSTCMHQFVAGTVVTLSATAKAGSTFAGWFGACTGTGTCIVTMSTAKTVKARFTPSLAAHRAASH